MRNLYCATCGTLIAELAEGSRLKKGSVYHCRECHDKKTAIPEFLRGFGLAKKP